MGLSIFLKDERKQLRSKRYPLRVTWEFTCDGDGHGFVGQPVAEFYTDAKEFAYAKAMRAGWKESHNRYGRKFFCPGCSGKVRQATGD